VDIEIVSRVISIMKKEPSFLKLKGRVMIVGDTHGDVVITKEIVSRFFNTDYDTILFLGDYVDRAPEDVDSSFPNLDFLIKLKAEYPSKVFLLKGNHEAGFAIPFWPSEFEHELMNEGEEVRKAYMNLFRAMPLMAMVNNVYAAHAAFPFDFNTYAITKTDIKAIEEITWSDAEISPVYREIGKRFDETLLHDFLSHIGAEAFVRGHDPYLNGVIVYKKCLTIFSCRQYREYGNGGILIATVDGDIHGIEDIFVEVWDNGTWKKYTPLFFRDKHQ